MAWYVYGVTSREAETPADLRGLDDAPVRLHGGGDLRLAVSELHRPLEELQYADPEDAVAAVRRHDDVLSGLATVASVLPIRFGTVLPDRAAADDLLAERHGAFMTALTAVAGADEWVVQIDVEEGAGQSRDVDDASESDAGLTPGHAFFARKRSQRDERARARAAAAAAAADLEHRLSGLARATRPLSRREPETVARAAYLVEHAARDDFLAAATEAEVADVTVQGPLPPYRFVDEERP